MSKQSPPKDKVQQATELLFNGARTVDAAEGSGLTLNQVTHIRAKLVLAGILDRKRRKTKRSSPVTKTLFTPLPVVDNTPDLAPVVGTETFVFRIDNMEVQVKDATKVRINKGMIEIKY